MLMQLFGRFNQVKILLVAVAVVIALASLYVSQALVADLSVEERNKMETWAEALRAINNADENVDLTLVLKVLTSNRTIPVIAVDQDGRVQTYRNLVFADADTAAVLANTLARFKQVDQKIRISLTQGNETVASDEPSEYMDVYYDDSLMLKRLATYPYIQWGVVLIFVLVAIFALLSSKRAEQNKVWVGLSKETAHQLGTPISSLMAWQEILQDTYPKDELIPEMANDVRRLQMIADRFSKIGSLPELKETDLLGVIDRVVTYISRRASNKVQFEKEYASSSLMVKMCPPLFEWVLENLCKNAMDAMDGQGVIRISIQETSKRVYVDVADTGKGLPKSKFKAIFTPGYTTKKRGWGLGLSLAKRIVEVYHQGRIYVKQSELNKGTVFRIELKK